MSEPADRFAITVDECARRLGISRASAYQAARKGELPSLRVGNRLLIPLPALEKLLVGEAPRGGAGRGEAV